MGDLPIMSVKKKSAIEKAGQKHIQKGFSTLKKFIKIYNDFKIIPDEEYATITLFSFKGKKVKARRINGVLTMNLKQISIYIDGKYSTIKDAFQRNDFQEGRHYFIGGTENPSTKNMTFLGIQKLLRHTRTGYAEDFLDDLSEYINDNMNPITISEFLLINKDKKLIPQYLGDPKREWVAEDGDILESRGEMIIDNILFKLKIPHQPKPRIFLPPELEKKFNRKYPIVPDWNIKMRPRTIIEYWGRDGPDYIKLKKWKQEMYEALGIHIINIEPTEVQNIPILTERLKKLLL